jgi:hypothetical protein
MSDHVLSLAQSFRCAAICVASLIFVAAPVSAAPVGGLSRQPYLTRTAALLFEPVQYRRQYDGRRHNGYGDDRYRGNGGRNLALAIGSLIIGGIILSEAARSEHRQNHASDWQRCAATYRSFEADTGLYTGYDGMRRPCPYLR